MRLMSFVGANGSAAWGIQQGEGVVPGSALGPDAPATLQGLVEQSCSDAGLLARLAAKAAGLPTTPLAQLQLLPVMHNPAKIICLGVNYHDHAKEGGNTVAEYPAFFLRVATSLLAHGAPMHVPRISSKLDFEAELALVVGKRARFVSEADALQHVFGYSCFNDGSVRDYQRKTTQWTIGKNFDGTGGFGPALVTADELPPGCVGLHIESRLNGQVMQSATTSDMVFGVARTVSLLSEALTLEPGDVVVMGTPAGVGYARTPPVWMKAGDTIEIDIERVGVLRNPVV